VKQRKELERVSQIALQQHEDIEYQNNLIITLTEQCQKQQELIRDLDSTVNIERHLCDNAIRISKRLESTSTPTVNENGEDEQTKRLLAQAEDDNAPEEKPTTPTQHEKQTKDPIYLVVDDNENPELDTVQELREENGLLRMELFSEREERHKIEYEKIHLLELVQQLSSRLNQ
jgi:tRNA 2-selenouridine synthase SelU